MDDDFYCWLLFALFFINSLTTGKQDRAGRRARRKNDEASDASADFRSEATGDSTILVISLYRRGLIRL